MAFPNDRYTPYGYLDLPQHTRRLNPLGVLRSEGIGFMWHFPAYARGYGGRQPHYVAGFRLSIGGAIDIEDFDPSTPLRAGPSTPPSTALRAGLRAVTVDCPYHSKNIVEFACRTGSAAARAVFHPVGDHALRCRLEVRGSGHVRIAAHALYRRWIAAAGAWGESGLVGTIAAGRLTLQGFESGEAFVLACSAAPHDWGLSADPAAMRAWADHPASGESGPLPVVGRPGEMVALCAALGFEMELSDLPQAIEIHMARGLTADRAQATRSASQAQAAWSGDPRRTGDSEEARLRAEDARFWQAAPRLEGDWPDHWRRGLVYDLETVRMMVRPPIGIYRHAWDAMQIQAPRVVLAETAIDALLLAYADPALAAELLLGVFADASEPNVPCSREDGSYNMVSADGVACGTAPEWGFPWLALAHVAALRALRADRPWLERLYPYLAAYLDWWLAHRRDADGWLVYACSWESGQDDSPRFGDQPLGGGHPIGHVRPVDLQAAFAHAARVMAGLAEQLERTQDVPKWTVLSAEFQVRTDQLWNGIRYADYDAHTGELTAVDDVMLLTPLALGVAHPERVAALRPRIEALNADDLTWPMLAWTATEAALHAGLFDKAAELAWAVCERAYRFWDARRRHPDRTSPGIACEYWPLDGRCGGEGYGWGAFTTHLVIHTLIGLSFTDSHVMLCPNLPPAWREPGRRYSVRLLARGRPLSVTLEPLDAARVRVALNDFSREVIWGERIRSSWETL